MSLSSLLRNPVWWHLIAILVVGAWFESLFIHHGVNPLDGGWPVYAAMRLHQGGSLYQDVSWCFPPGHVIPAWIGYAIEPPGIVATRYIYAGFCLALSVALYLLGRRLMPAPFALLATAIVTVGAPESHLMHYLFAYRYLVFVIVALLVFAHRLETGERRWMVLAGLLTGIAVFFRVTPAFAVGCGIGVAVMSIDRDWRGWLVDWGWFAAGIALIVVPVFAWFEYTVGLVWLYHENLERPLAMLQAMPWPDVVFPTTGNRHEIRRWFEAIQFRTHWFLYAFYLIALGWQWVRALRRREPFAHALLLAVAVFGCVFFSRSLGRSDRSHLDSAIPPVCLLMAHALSLGFARVWPRLGWRRGEVGAQAALCTAFGAVWLYLGASDTYVPEENRGTIPLASTDNRISTTWHNIADLDGNALAIRGLTEPGSILLDLTASPVFHVLTGRTGPGYTDVVMPGTFMTKQEEIDFVARLEAAPPAAVLWPRTAFDNMPSRGIQVTAPLVSAWVRERYVPHRYGKGGTPRKFILLRPRPRAAAAATRSPG